MKFLAVLLCGLLVAPSLAAADGFVYSSGKAPDSQTVLLVSGVPFIKASSGTMGNNGAVSAMTALPKTYSSGAWLYLPAGAVAAGVPSSASWLWFVASSTTAGTVYNSTYTSGPVSVGVTTAFVTTGPGAFTGSTATINGPTITIPAGLMGRNGRLEIIEGVAYNNTAGNKITGLSFGGSTTSVTETTGVSGQMTFNVTNRGLTNVQTQTRTSINAAAATSVTSLADFTVDTTANVTLNLTLNTAAATDHDILENYRAIVYPAN